MAEPTKHGTRRLSAPDRRRSILEAALRCFAERGYDGASVDEIAGEAGITVAVIYSHFKSKEELYTTILEEQWQSLLTHQAEVVLETPPGRDRLRVAYTAFFEWFEAHPLAWRLLFRDVGAPAAVAAAQRRMLDTVTRAIVALLASEDPADRRLATEPGVVIVAEFLKGGMNAVARWWYDHPDVPRQEIVDLLVDVTWRGFEPLGVEGKKPRA